MRLLRILNYIAFFINLGKKGALVKERLKTPLLLGKYGARRKRVKKTERKGCPQISRDPRPGPVLGPGIRAVAPANQEGSFPRGGAVAGIRGVALGFAAWRLGFAEVSVGVCSGSSERESCCGDPPIPIPGFAPGKVRNLSFRAFSLRG